MVKRSVGLLLISLLLIGVAAVSGFATSLSPSPNLKVFAFFSYMDGRGMRHLEAASRHIDVLAPQWYTLDLGTQTISDRPPDPAIVYFPGRTWEIWPTINSQVGEDSSLLETRSARGRVVTAIADLTSRYGYTGVTLDIEGVAGEQRKAFSFLIEEISAAMHERGRSVAVYAPRRTAARATDWAAAYDWRALSDAADLLLVAGYPESYVDAGPIVTTNGYSEVLDYASSISTTRIAPIVGALGFRWRAGEESVTNGPDEMLSTVDAVAARRSFGREGRRSDGETRFRADKSVWWYENLRGLKARASLTRDRTFQWLALFSIGREPLGLWEHPPFADT